MSSGTIAALLQVGEVTALLLVAADVERRLFHLELDLVLGETGHRHGDAVGGLAGALDVVRRITDVLAGVVMTYRL